MAVLDASAWAGRIPHHGRMALIEQVLEHDADSVLAHSDNHRAPDHPLRRNGRLHAVHLCEYGAQAMAVHGALHPGSEGTARPGLLVALREVELSVAYVHDLPGPLCIRAWREQADDRIWLYRFEIHHDGQRLASGRAMVILEEEAS